MKNDSKMTAVDGGEGVSNNFDPLSLYRLAPVKKFWQWVREGKLVTWNTSKSNRASPTFPLPGDDRIPEGVKLITK